MACFVWQGEKKAYDSIKWHANKRNRSAPEERQRRLMLAGGDDLGAYPGTQFAWIALRLLGLFDAHAEGAERRC